MATGPVSAAVTSSRRGRRGPGSGPDAPTPGSAADRTPDADPEQVARLILLRRLESAPRTRAELRGDLTARGVPDDVAERMLDRFTEVGLIDDAAYAEAWVRSRHAGRGLARRALAAELHRKGIDRDTAQAALEAVDADDERARAVELVRRRLPSLSRVAPEARARRLVGMLARKGYSPGLAAAVVRQELAADPLDDHDGWG
ncbi:MAG: regulatory protein RecX [Candidatus Nanopelagicales bacterium]